MVKQNCRGYRNPSKGKDTQIEIKAADFVYIIDKRTALFEQIQFAGRNYLKRPMELNIWRAPTDNDMYMKEVWKKPITMKHIRELMILRFARTEMVWKFWLIQR